LAILLGVQGAQPPTVVNKLHCALPAWWGFANASKKNSLEAFLRRAGKSGYYTDDFLPNVAALCEQADEQLFRSIRSIYTFIFFDHSYQPSAVHHIEHVRDHITTKFPLK